MTVLTDIANAMDRYPLDETTIDFVEVAAVDSVDGTAINANEKWKFKVKVTNHGHVNMTDVFLHVNGDNGAIASFSPTTGFDKDLTLKVGPLKVDGGDGTATTDFLYFKAPPTTKAAGTSLLGAHIFDWNGNFDHYFTNHTKDEDHATVTYPIKKYLNQVFPA
jgi:hypothetical protein